MGQITAIITLVVEIVRGLKFLAEFVQANKEEAWFQTSAKLFQDLRSADTPEKKKDVAKRLRDLFNTLD